MAEPNVQTEPPYTPSEMALSGTLIWEPLVQHMTSLEFRCLVQRMLDRLDKQGWMLVRTQNESDC